MGRRIVRRAGRRFLSFQLGVFVALFLIPRFRPSHPWSDADVNSVTPVWAEEIAAPLRKGFDALAAASIGANAGNIASPAILQLAGCSTRLRRFQARGSVKAVPNVDKVDAKRIFILKKYTLRENFPIISPCLRLYPLGEIAFRIFVCEKRNSPDIYRLT